MSYRSRCFFQVIAFLGCSALFFPFAVGQTEEPGVSEIRAESTKLTAAFNGGKADDVAALFLPKAELIDESGNAYQGQAAIRDLIATFFEKFPGTQMETAIESIRMIGPVSIEEGTRFTTSKDGTSATIRYVKVLARVDQGWRIASIRDYAEESIPTPGELLKPLDWLIGDWINEGADARVKLAYRWSEDGNFILAEISVTKNDNTIVKTTQRIGWDPLLAKPRSWTFDSDGGFSEATWTQVDNAWLLRSSAVLPDGQTGSANLTLTPDSDGRFVMTGTNRVVGDNLEVDFEIAVVKQPPAASK
jgi:uncharacterized protein (TIGR02246 family)